MFRKTVSSNTQDIVVLASPKSAVFNIVDLNVTFNFYFLNSKFQNKKFISVPECISAESLVNLCLVVFNISFQQKYRDTIKPKLFVLGPGPILC